MSRALPAVALLALAALSACDCGGGTGSVKAGFRTATTELDFGKVLEGAQVTRQVELEATGRGDVVVAVAVTAPFSAPESIEVPGGSTATLNVTFTAGADAATGTLTLSSNGESFEIELRGRGVHPLDCQPSAACRVARFVLETETCEESVADDGAGCTPESVCLENGVCRSGACVGTPRSCSDSNACTQDGCVEGTGCVHVDISAQCPPSQNPCEMPTCSPATGCGIGPRDDGTICGAIDCVTANLCQAGLCKAVPTPDGFLCAPATPCQGEGHCQMGECRRPDAGEMSSDWNLIIGATDAGVVPAPGRMLVHQGNLYFTACGLNAEDGGCAVSSYTSNGFFRFDLPFPNEPTLHAVTGSGGVVEEGGVVQSFAPASGAALWTFALDGGVLPRGGVAQTDAGTWMFALSSQQQADDGGVPLPVDGVALLELDPDGGAPLRTQSVFDAGFGTVIALSADGTQWLYAPDGRAFRLTGDGDGGVSVTDWGVWTGDGTLTVSEGNAIFGSAWLAQPDGGTAALLDGGETPLGLEALSSGGLGFTFFRACRPPFSFGCAAEEESLQVRAFAAATGVPLWEQKVAPALAPGIVVEASALGGALAGSLLTLTQVELQSGVRVDLQLFSQGKRLMLCPLPGAPRVHAARIADGNLYVLLSRGGTWSLEAYSLKGIPLGQSGWPVPGTRDGSRRER